jgi:hypothetical protein
MVRPKGRLTSANNHRTVPGELAIFARLLESARGELTPSLARYLLTLGFADEDQARMTDLASRNQDSALSPTELDELTSYVKAGHLLALLHAKARQALRRAKAS